MAQGTMVYAGGGGGNNTYVKDHAATGHLVTQFARNPKKFPYSRYVQQVPVKKGAGYYLKLDTEQAARFVGGNLKEFVWPDGNPRPRRNNGTSKFAFADYLTERYDFDFSIGYKSRDQAGWNIVASEQANHAHKAMTGRTLRAHIQLQNNANWDSTHRADVTTDIAGNSGGRLDISTTARMDIKRSINHGVDQIRKSTLGVVKNKEDMVLVMSPYVARRLGESQEMINALIQSPDALKHWKGVMPDYSDYGIPNMLYGIEVVIEDTVLITSAAGATLVRTDVCSSTEMYLLSRPGGMTAVTEQGPTFSTLMSFVYEDMTVETLDHPNDRLSEGHVVDDTAEQLVSPVSGFKFTNVVS